MSNLLLDSIQGNLILEGLELFLRECILPIFALITHRGPDSYQKVYEVSGRDSQWYFSAP